MEVFAAALCRKVICVDHLVIAKMFASAGVAQVEVAQLGENLDEIVGVCSSHWLTLCTRDTGAAHWSAVQVVACCATIARWRWAARAVGGTLAGVRVEVSEITGTPPRFGFRGAPLFTFQATTPNGRRDRLHYGCVGLDLVRERVPPLLDPLLLRLHAPVRARRVCRCPMWY